jgi:hypothetical protein
MVSHEVPPHKFVIGDESNMSSHFKQLFLEDNTATRLLAAFTEIQEWSTQSVFSVIIMLGGYIVIWVYVCGWHGTWWQQQWLWPNMCTERQLKADLIMYVLCASDTHKQVYCQQTAQVYEYSVYWKTSTLLAHSCVKQQMVKYKTLYFTTYYWQSCMLMLSTSFSMYWCSLKMTMNNSWNI